MSEQIEPFILDISEHHIEDLHRRLDATRWPDAETVDDLSQGPPLAKIQALADYWRHTYDWRRCENLLNEFGQYRTEIDGVGVHFLHVRSPEPDALPLLMSHGWPGSVLEFRDVIGPLTDPVAHGGDARDAFHVIAPSIPGFGFSDRPAEPGWNLDRISDAWITLMQRLGYEKWAAQGGDWGSGISEAVGFKQPPGLVGLHLNIVMYQPTQEDVSNATPAEQAMLEDAQRYQNDLSGYNLVQSTRPQSLGFSLADSPVGLAAWIYAMFQDVSDSAGDPESVFSLDEMLDDIMLYWISNTGASSIRLYWEGMQQGRAGAIAGGQQPTPTGISMFPRELIRLSQRWAEKRFPVLLSFNEHDAGGHFAAMEQPAAFVGDVRATFRSLR